MFFVIVGTLFVLLNLADIGPFGAWTWEISGDLWKFCLPFGLAALWWMWTDKSGLDKRREIEKMEAKKLARRSQNLDSLGMDSRGNVNVVNATVPLAEMFGYSTTLRSMSSGKATYSMEFEKYSPCPRNIQEAVLEARKKKLAADDE